MTDGSEKGGTHNKNGKKKKEIEIIEENKEIAIKVVKSEIDDQKESL